MKKVFNSFSLIFATPAAFFKKLKKDNFIAGLIFGALFSLIVNIATVQIQEEIQKQRILEAVENEILTNALQANNVIKNNAESLKRQDLPNFFHAAQKYSRDIWEQSSEPLQYLVQLDTDIQVPVLSFYTITIPGNNQLLNRLEQLRGDKLSDCFGFGISEISKTDKDICKNWNNTLLDLEIQSANAVSSNGLEVLKKFHPTQDRLRNTFLSFLMGNKSTRVLSGK